MRQHYKLAMPNQNVSPEDVDKIISFLKAKSKVMMEQSTQPSSGEITQGLEYGNGKEIYEKVCIACHMAGVTGAPKFDEKERWQTIANQGLSVLENHALNGFQGFVQ